MTDKGEENLPPYRAPNPLGELIFDKADYADVVFIFPDTRQRIFANQAILAQSFPFFEKEFSQESATADSTILIDTLDPRPPALVSEGPEAIPDEDDMGAFDDGKSGTDELTAPPIPTKLDAITTSEAPSHDPSCSESVSSDPATAVQSPKRKNEGGPAVTNDDTNRYETRQKKRRKVVKHSAEAVPNSGNLRRMRRFDVTSDSVLSNYVAFRGFLAYLHTGALPLSPLPSDYLVARQEAFCKATATPKDFEFPPRGEWLRNAFYQLRGQPDWKSIEPCSPHTLFRIADEVECVEVGIIARERIKRSLTVENAAYELFSPLSAKEYDDIEEDVFPFFRAIYKLIKKTEAWKRVRK
ncbi:hypothetical protein JCM16303_006689 [Sporobolomyces ruberrimus]